MTEQVTTQLKEVYDKGRTAKNLIPQGRIPDLGWNTDQQGGERQPLLVETQPEATVTQTTPDPGERPPSSQLHQKHKLLEPPNTWIHRNVIWQKWTNTNTILEVNQVQTAPKAGSWMREQFCS